MADRSQGELERLATQIKERFDTEKRVMSFQEYVGEFLQHPWRHSRDASRYLRDCMDHYGDYQVDRPEGPTRRYRLFDQEFVRDRQTGDHGHARLVGHEALQVGFYRVLSNFVREGRANRLILLHGPNDSAKSTFIACLMRALEHYSSTPDGALYRFAWVFPVGQDDRHIGFGKTAKSPDPTDSYAHMDHERMAAKLTSSLREHPLLLLPLEERRQLLRRAYDESELTDTPPERLWSGMLGHKNAAVFDAMLTSYDGDLKKVLSHIQVERYYVSRRYRTGAVTIGPEMAVDAQERQITADRTMAALPAALSALDLFETQGELVDGAGGLIEYSDMLKRPLEAWRYLLAAIETGEVSLNMSVLTLDAVLTATSNEIHVEALRQNSEYNSFRARLSPLRVGYLLHYPSEQEIYEGQIIPQVRRHVAPHAAHVAALWAVLTRLLHSDVEHYEDPALGKIAADLTAMEKATLHAHGKVPRRLDTEQAKCLRAGAEAVINEYRDHKIYEGITGASPREVRTLLLDAAQHPEHECLSPMAVLDQIEHLCQSSDHEFLQVPPKDGFHTHLDFVTQVRDVWLDMLEAEVRNSTGLVEDSQYETLFTKYVMHVSLWVKGERYHDPITGQYQDPDPTLFKRIEGALGIDDTTEAAEEFRRNLISTVAAHAIDNPGEPVNHNLIFPRYLERLQEAYFGEHREQVEGIIEDMLSILSDDGKRLEPARQEDAAGSIKKLEENFGYCRACARASLSELVRTRYGA